MPEIAHGTLMATAAAIGFWIVCQGQEENIPRARTAAFCVAAYSQLFFSVSCRSMRHSVAQLGLCTNPYLLAAIVVSGILQLSVVARPFAQTVFETATQLGWEWTWIGLLSLAPVTVIEVWKLLRSAVWSARRGPAIAHQEGEG